LGLEEPVELSGDIADQAASDFAVGLALSPPAGGVGAGRRVIAQAGQHDQVQSLVELAVAGAVEPVAETVARLATAIRAAGAKLFVVDHSGEAQQVGMVLCDTKLLVFGNPVGGTPAMAASPLVALDLPLKVLVWMDDDGAV
jgi:hypothetical protein